MFLTKDNKSPFYQMVYFIDGKRTKKSTKKTIRAEALEVLKAFEKNHNGNSGGKLIRLTEFQNEYVEHSKQSKSIHYIRSINLSFSQLIQFTGNIPIQNLTTRILDKFLSATYSRAKGAAGLYYRTLKAAFSKAAVWEYISENPLKKIKAPKQIKSLPIFINKKDFQKILNHTKHQFLKDIFITGFYSGMRLGELVNMNWSWIDFNQNLITVKNSNSFTTKSKEERVIPIHQKVKEVLTKWYATNGKSSLLFYRYEGIKLNENFVSKQFKKVVRLAGLTDDIHFHTLRHSFASNLVQSGSSLYIVKELLGHQDFSTTQIYSHLEKKGLQKAVSML